jgi:CubicO group peptidase (beta-lactamase class C family)
MTLVLNNGDRKRTGGMMMKKALKIFGIGVMSIAVLSVPAAYVFGSTTHSDLKGSKYEKVHEYMDDFAKEEDFNGTVLVVHKGKVVLDESYGLADREENSAFTNDMLFPVGSINKPITATAIMQLEEQQKLSVNDPLSDYFPDLPNSEKITLHQLLNHSSGLVDHYASKEIRENYTKAHSDQEIMDSFQDKELLSEPGEKYAYISSDYYLLGKIIEKVSGEDYHSYVQKNIFDKADMQNTFIMTEENRNLVKVKGYEDGKYVENLHPSLGFGNGNLVSTKEDIAKFVAALDNHQLIGKKQLDKMTSQTIKVSLMGVHYGYGFYSTDNFYSFDEKQMAHGGSMPGLRSGLIHYPEKELTIIIFSNNGEAWNYAKPSNGIASIILDKRYWFYHSLY